MRKYHKKHLQNAPARRLAYVECRHKKFHNLKILIMHNIDRTVGETNYEYNNESYETNPEFGFEDEFLNELNETSGETYEYQGELPGETYGETSYETNELSNESMEMELATELLNVSNEAELEQFLGGLIKKAAGAVKSFANSSAGRAVGGFLKSAAKKALPIVGRVAGTYFGGPLGGQIGSQLGSAASNLFELELEGLSNEDKEFELSRAYVRFANAAVKQAVQSGRNPRFRGNPLGIAKNAVVSAARRHAPGLLRPIRPYRQGYRRPYNQPLSPGYAANNYNQQGYDDGMQQSTGSSGTWYKQGNQIILNL